ncbi:MAG: PAS domain-containing protein [Gammaproteobacteria bacterium]
MGKSAKIAALEPQRGTVAFLAVDERTTQAVTAHLKTGYQFEHFASHEPLVSALGLGSLHVDVLIVGQDFEAALNIALTVRKSLRCLQVILLAELRNVDALKRQAEIQSDNTDEVTIWPSQHLQDLPDAVRRAVKRAHRRVRADQDKTSRDDGGKNGESGDISDHLTRLLERAPIGILTISLAGDVRTLNAQARDLLGLATGKMINRPIYEFFPVFEQKKLRKLLRQTEDADTTPDTEQRILRVLGDEKRFLEIIVAGDVEQLEEHCTMLILHDVTSIVHAEQAQQRTAAALQASEDRFNELADAMRMIPWEADPATLRITFIGRLVEDVIGYAPSLWLSKNFWVDRLHPDDRRRTLDMINRNTRRLQNFDHEFRMYDVDGRVRWLRNIVNVVRADDGVAQRIRGFIVDITESKQSSAN